MNPRLTVPGNLLIAGEYMVLEPGGLGIGVAADVRVTVRTTAASALEIRGRMGDEETRWPGQTPRNGLLDAVVRTVLGGGPAPKAGIEIDSTPFFQGRKLGFGSSAAVTVALTAALLELRDGSRPDRAAVFHHALAAHRAFQGGSGYDVATSVYGGAGLFQGGETPLWVPAHAAWLEGARLFHGPAAVRTPGATRRYREWKAANPEAHRRHLERSNELVRALLASPDARVARDHLSVIAALGVELGDRIGVSARLGPPEGVDPGRSVWKALGAGNEIGLLLPAPGDTPAPGTRALAVAPEGLTWL